MINTLLHVVAEGLNNLENAFLFFSIKLAFLSQPVKLDIVFKRLFKLYIFTNENHN